MAINIKAKQRGRRTQLMSEINVTPFVDVLLVLLIIFIISTPMMIGGMDVNLPKGANKMPEQKDDPIIVTINKSGEIFLLKKKLDLVSLPREIRNYSVNSSEEKIYIKGDKNIDYGLVMEVVKIMEKAGFKKVSLVTELE